LAVSRLRKKIGTVTVVTAVLPTSYAKSASVLREAIDEAKPDIVLCVGQAGGRTELSLERIGINVQDARIPDNDRKQPIDVPVRADGPAAYFATLPVKACVAAMRKAGLPAAVGAAIADPGRRVMALQGDGSLLFGIHALWTAAHQRAPVALVVADNGGYEILRAGMEGLTGRPEGAWPGLAVTDPSLDIPALCRGFGASAERVTTRAELPDALGDLWDRARGGPAALVVRVAGRTAPVGYPLTP
jgi:hypothetical protein